MPGNFEEIGTFSRIGNEDSAEEVSSVRGDIFGEGEWCRNDIFIEEVDIVAFGVRWVIVEWKIPCKHCILLELANHFTQTSSHLPR
jgi:hypothetical protein